MQTDVALENPYATSSAWLRSFSGDGYSPACQVYACCNNLLYDALPSTDVRKGWWVNASLESPLLSSVTWNGVSGNDVAAFLSGGDYYGAFDEFIDGCSYQIRGEREGFPFNFGMSLLVSLAIGFVVALIATGIMRAKLRSVRTQSAAREYIKPGSMKLTADAV